MPDQLQRTSQIQVTDPEAGLKITEIFCSLQGESGSAGALTTFVRLTGCPLRCSYCDTPYAFSGGTRYSLDWIIDQVKGLGARQVCVTGGEVCLPRLVVGVLSRAVGLSENLLGFDRRIGGDRHLL